MENEYLENVEHAVAAVFLSYFNRAPEFQAMQWYVDLYSQLLQAQGDSPTAVPDAFKKLSAQIYVDGVGSNEVPAGLTVTNAWYVNHLYQNILGREADPQGLEFWRMQLDTGEIERAELVSYILDAARGDLRDAAYVANRTDVAVAFSQWGNSNPNVLAWLEYDAAQVLVGVNENIDTVEMAEGRLYEATSPQGDVHRLTTEVDEFQGGTRSDTFNAYTVDANGNPASTLTAFDAIDGGAGVDVLNVYTDAVEGLNSVFPVGATVRNVEIVNFFNLTQGDGVIDASRFEGAEQLWQLGNAFRIDKLGADTILGFRNLEAGQHLVVTPDVAAASATIVFDKVADGVSRLSVESVLGEGALGSVKLSGALVDTAETGFGYLSLDVRVGKDVQTLNLDTNISLGLYVLSNGKPVTEIDASESTGDIIYLVADSVKMVSTGSGDDVIHFAEDRPLDLADHIDGGDGTDLVVLNNATFQTQDYDAIRQLQNIERLGFAHDYAVVDASQVAGFKALVVNGGSDLTDDLSHVTIRNLASDQVVQVMAVNDDIDDAGYVTLEKAAADVVVESINFPGSSEAGFYLVAQAKPGDATEGTLTLRGDAWIAFENQSGKFSTIDATKLDGGLDLSFWVNVDATEPETGMSSAVIETVLLGEGSDWITVGVSFGNDGSSSTIGKMDTIIGFDSVIDGPDATHDILFGFDQLTELELSAAATTIWLAFSEAANQYVAGTGDEVNALFFYFEGDTYLYADTCTDEGTGRYDNADFAIKLIGEHDFSQIELITYPY